MNKKVYIIYTGGTIGMVRTTKGYAPQKGYMKKELDNISELKADIMPDYTIKEYEPLLDSSNMTQQEWIKIAKDIESNYDDYDGFVILHGTDTMAYTASALSFMLENLSKPVILTGSQIPLCEIRNDARENIIAAVQIAAECEVPEVCLYFGGKLLRGCRAVKTSSDALDAFESPNFPPLAIAGVRIEVNESLVNKKNGEKMVAFEYGNYPITDMKIFPSISSEVMENILKPPLRGIIIEALGAGNIPSRDARLGVVLKEAADRGVIIVVCTQCLKGFAHIGEYETSAFLVEAGAVSGYDMTPEAAATKLYYLMSKGYDQETIKHLMTENLRGELSKI